MSEITFTSEDQKLLQSVAAEFPIAFESAVDSARPLIGPEKTLELMHLMKDYLLRKAEVELAGLAVEGFIERRSGIEAAMTFRDDAIDAFTKASMGVEYERLSDFADAFAATDEIAAECFAEGHALVTELRARDASWKEIEEQVGLLRETQPNLVGSVWPVVEKMDVWLQERFF